MNKVLDIDIAWGGYYLSKEEDGNHFTLFRLLDFNHQAYHAALFTKKLESMPSLDEVTSLSPFIAHAPMDAKGLLTGTLELLGTVPLVADDLDGYMVYLEHHEVSQEERNELRDRLIGFSHELPLGLRLEVDGDELLITGQ